MEYRSIYELFREVSSSNTEGLAYRSKREGQWVDTSWAEHAAEVARVGKSLIALGVQHGDRVSILALSRQKWVQCDIATVNIGGVTVGIYPANLAVDCGYIINHSDSEIIFVDTDEQLQKILSIRAELPRLHKIVVFDGDSDPANGVLSWEDFLRAGEKVGDEEYVRRGEAVRSDDLASIVYTSGTTGTPKGVMLTNGNLVFTTLSVCSTAFLEKERYTTLFFLPLAHVFARLIAYAAMARSHAVAFAENMNTVADNLKEIKPHFIPAVPRIYEKVYDKITGKVEAAGGLKPKLFNWAVGVGGEVSRRRRNQESVPLTLKMKHALADKLVLHKIRDAFGGRLKWAASGAAPLNKSIAEFFDACGVIILEGIGMTENTSFSHMNRLSANKYGTVGQVGAGIEHQLAEDGEVLIRGPNVMKGYFKDPEATAATIDSEGWLHSGDIGEIDEDGFLKITDRKKDLIITAQGKNVAPQRVERILRTSHYIGQVVAYGDKKKYLTALITLDPDNIKEWAAKEGLDPNDLEAMAANPKVRELIDKEVEERNSELASFETIKKFKLLPLDFSIEAGEMTPSLKIKRKVVVDKYRDDLEALYRE
jgi:long-chain acyl-CoA synthetase